MSDGMRARLLSGFGRIVDALADSRRANRTALMLIGGYVLVWWVYAVIAKSSQDIHFDMGEVAAWSLVPAFGYPKHPPFPGWVAAAWFAVFPRADWAFYLLATVSIGVALWFVWLIAARYVEGPKRALALAMLTFSPGFNFQPLKFNSNALLIPAWAAASYLFLRSFTQRTALWGALAGAAAAIAMLTKYWSVFLILGFIVAALAHPRRLDYLRSPAPWASVIVGALLMAPNIVSLVDYDFGPFRYATSSHGVATLRALMDSFSDYFGGVLYLAGGLAAVAIACRPGPATIRDMAWPREPDRRLMMIATATALLAPVALALVLRTQLATLWTLPMWAMLPAALLSSPRLMTTRDAAAGVLAAACAFPLIALLAAPVVAIVVHRDGISNHASHYRLIADAVDKAWREATDKPLRVLGSDTNIGNGASFYLPSRPYALDIVDSSITPWAEAPLSAGAGAVFVCAEMEGACMAALEARATRASVAKRSTVTISRSYLGVADAPVRYMIVIVPPAP